MVSLLTQLFSFRRGSMRAIRLHRVVQVLWLLPLFVFLLITNNLALIIDWILFPRFKKQVIKNPIFIASLPRTGTTNLLHSLTSIDTPFTAMSLWEIILAPSIIQKKIKFKPSKDIIKSNENQRRRIRNNPTARWSIN